MKCILDCDPGNGWPAADVDDGLALGLILRSPELELLAVTVCAGNTPIARGVPSGLAVLEAAGSTVPLYAGGGRPLLEDARPWRTALDRRSDCEPALRLYANLPRPAPRMRVTPGGAAEAIVRIVDAHPGEVTIFAVGPLTNLAQAIVLDPELPLKAKRFVLMGGAFGVPHKPQELNFCYDPEAARIVVTAGCPVLLVPLDTTLKTTLTLEQNASLTASADPLAHLLGATGEPWIRYLGATRGRSGMALHDPLAVAAAIDPSLVTIERVPVDVELAGRLTRGRPVSWIVDDPSPNPGVILPSLNAIEVATDVDGPRFVRFMLDRLLHH